MRIHFENADLILNILGNILTIIASVIAIYLFFSTSSKIKTAFSLLLNYSHQLTLTDLKFKIERLNNLFPNEVFQVVEVVNILHEIEGQILGNKFLAEELVKELAMIRKVSNNTKTITEARTRLLASHLRESIRNLDITNIKTN